MQGKGIASVGECMIELSGRGDGAWRMGFAGDTLNTLWAIRALTGPAIPASYVSAFGDDPFSRDQIAFFDGAGIGIGHSPVIAGARPGLYAITLTGAERSFTYWRGDAAARRLAGDPAALARSLQDQALVYFSGISLAILDEGSRAVLLDALATARAAGSTIAFDGNYRPRLWASQAQARGAIDAALAVSDIALPTFPDEALLYGEGSPHETAARMGAAGVREIVVKDGEAPAHLSAGGATARIPALRVQAVDTTGAGDSFNGGYLAARLRGHDPEQAVRLAHSVAATVVQHRGALAPFEALRAAFTL